MIQTFFIYLFVPLFAIILSKKQFQKVKIKDEVPVLSLCFYSGLVLIVIALIFGMRHTGFGIDFRNYVEHYVNFDYSSRLGTFELGYNELVKIFSSLGIHFSVFFIIIEYMTLYLLFKSLNRNYYLLPFVMFFLFTTGFVFDTTNLVRHTVAFAIFAYSIRYIEERKPYKYLAFIFLAFLFHKSALILLPFYLILSFDWFKRRAQFSIFIGIFLLVYFMDGFRYLTLFGLEIFEYGKYLTNLDITFSNTVTVNTGLGILVFTAIDIVMIYFFSPVLKKKYPSFKFYYNLHIFGLLVSFITSGVMIMARANYYFITFRIFTLSFFLHYLFKSKDKFFHLLGVFIILMYVIGFYMKINTPGSNYTPFLFFFQE